MRCLNAKSKSIIKHCKYTHFYTYGPCGRLPIYRKAINYTKRDIYTVSLCHMRHNKLEYSYDSHLSLYYGTDLNDTMLDKCLNE